MKRLLVLMLCITACQQDSDSTSFPTDNTQAPTGREATITAEFTATAGQTSIPLFTTTPTPTSRPYPPAQVFTPTAVAYHSGDPLPTSEPYPSAEETTQTSTTPALPITEGQGTITISHYRYADAGNVTLYAGRTVTLTWETAPQGATSYEIILAPEEGPSILLGTDETVADGVQVEWLVPERISGALLGIAHYGDELELRSGWSSYVYSGELPPEGICTVSSGNIGTLELYPVPQADSASFGYIVPMQHAEAYERTENGWYRVDVGEAYLYSPSSPAERTGWVSREHNAEFFGPCADLPIVELTTLTITPAPGG